MFCLKKIYEAYAGHMLNICFEKNIYKKHILNIQSTLAITEFGITEISIQRKKPADFTKIIYK